jgi:hypothetical protein
MAHAHQDQLRRVVHGDEGEDVGVAHVGRGIVWRRQLRRGSTGAGGTSCCYSDGDALLPYEQVDCQGRLGRHHYGTHR